MQAETMIMVLVVYCFVPAIFYVCNPGSPIAYRNRGQRQAISKNQTVIGFKTINYKIYRGMHIC